MSSHQTSSTTTTTTTQHDTSDTASVATTSSLSSRLSLLKDKIRPSADDKARQQKAKDDVLRNQIRMNV
ncbi:hypothetical protein F5144DRAFT_602455 [Chaetomium tenue]|uniref:Uncharacterized protein n=1 Tax=Chaetomium tenue TaxID=1854479 RepID=A0ACB7P854_9PEZI|nr:hypothetical protein F5144DRAFT_602455 [Chaetomium globosum]